jgi:protoheme IX farnesyltransferase
MTTPGQMNMLPTAFADGAVAAGRGTVSDYVALLKPRVMALVIFTALVGLVIAREPMHPWMGFMTLFAIAMGAGASGALNMWFDADIDAVMARTSARPLPRGSILPGEALGFGMTLAVASVLLLGLIANVLSAALLAFTIIFYVVVYTMWLKRSTAQNIVIGGAAGALPPVIACSAATGSLELSSLSLFLIIFLWTPPHFWALALLRTDDYAKAAIPMLPVVAGEDETRRQILIYSVLLVLASFAPLGLGIAGWSYLAAAAVFGTVFLERAVRLYRHREGDPARRAAARLFGYSILYLFAIFAALLVERLLALPRFAGVFA